MMKRNYFICCLFALLSSLNVLAFDFEADGIYYTITGSGTVSVVKGTYDYDGDVTIPKTVSNGVETFSVTSIGESAFRSCGELVSVTMPEGLTTIGKEAFYQSGIKTVSLPSTLSSMGTSAFRECRNLTGIVLPDELKEIKECAFYYCENLKTMTLGQNTTSIERDAFRGTSITSVVIPKSAKKIGIACFSENSSLKSLVINNAAVFIDYDAFYNTGLESVDLGNAVTGFGEYSYYSINGTFRNCKALTKIVIPASMIVLSNNAFYGCSRLYDVTLPNTLTSIGDRVFEGCAITQIDLPASLTSIGEYAFSGCPFESIEFPSSLKTIGGYAFNNAKVKELFIPSSVIKIGAWAFENCTSLTKVKIDNAPVELGEAFQGCTSLTEVDLGNAVTSMPGGDAGCFRNCTSLTTIKLPNTIKVLGRRAFEGCTKLESVTLPNALTNIEDYAFHGCNRLKSLSLPNTLQSIGYEVFMDCYQLQSITLPLSMKSIGGDAFRFCTSLTSILIPEFVTNIGSQAFGGCNSLESVIFDNSVLAIGEYTFVDCSYLKNVELGKITSIANWAFKGCTSLEKIVIPNSVESLGRAFIGCSALKSVIIGTGVKSLDGYKWTGEGVFTNCTKLTSVEIKSNVLTWVGDCCFSNCRSLKKIELPASVTGIGQQTFDGCSVLSQIYMNPTTPPSISDNTFSDYETPTLHVPSSAKTAYTKADNWKNFKNVIAIGSEPKATAEEIAALDALLTEATTLYNGSVEGTEPGNYRPGAKASLKAVIDEVAARIKDNMLAEDVEDCTELLNTAMKSFKNKQVKNEIQTNNTLAFAGSLKAATGSEFRLPIEMNNTDAITGVQFDLYLPEGMNLSQDEYGDYNIELSERTTARRHSVASRVMSDGALRVVVSSQQNATFEGNSGTLLTLVLFPKSTLEAGDYDVELKNVILTDPDAKRYAAADMKSVITVSTYTMGDVNNDGHIDVADLAGVVRFILENADASLIFNAADMDGNGVIEINDYAALVNVILNQSTPSAAPQHRAKAIRNTVIGLSDLCMNTNGEGELMVRLDNNDMQYTGLQFDLRLPDSIELMDEGAEATGIHHGAWVQKRADGTYRVICASLMNDELREGNVLRLQVKVTGAVNRELEVIADNVVLSDVNAVRHEAASAKAALNTDDATSISEELRFSEESANVIFNLSGQRLNKLQKGVNIVNGKKTVVK